MASKLGYIPHDVKLTANNIQALTDGNVLYTSPVGFHLVSTATAGATTLTVRQLMGGIIFHDPQGSVNLTTPTAAQIVAEINGAATNMSFRFAVTNTGGEGEVDTLALGTGVTAPAQNLLNADRTIAPSATHEFVLILTDVTPGNEAATLYCVNVSAGTYA